MDGIHDLGGRHGFGRVETEETEEPFHEPWEGRVRGMVNAMSRPPDWSIDWFRHCREMIDPVTYLSRPYFDQWAQTYSVMLINSGLASVEEIASGKAAAAAPTDAELAPPLTPPLTPPMSAADVAAARPGALRFDREVDAAPRFAIGDRVRAGAHGHSGHTRLPAYARGRLGVISDHHGAHILPDDHARDGRSQLAEALYTVAFDAAELWPEAADSPDRVYINLWESYLEPVR